MKKGVLRLGVAVCALRLLSAPVAAAALDGQAALAAEEALALRLRSFVLQGSSWFFLLASLVLVVVAAAKALRWLGEVRRRRHPPTRVFRLQLNVRGPSRPLGLYTFDYYPVTVARQGAADLVLPGAGPGAGAVRFDYRQGQAVLQCEHPRLVNGVPCRQKKLKSGDRIAFGSYRLDFQDAAVDEQPLPDPGRPVFAWQLPLIAGLLALALVFRQAGAIPEEAGRQQRVIARAAEAATGTEGTRGAMVLAERPREEALLAMASADLPDPRGPGSVTPAAPPAVAAKPAPQPTAALPRSVPPPSPQRAPAPPRVVTTPGPERSSPAPQPEPVEAAAAVASLQARPDPQPSRRALRVYAPGQAVAYFEADLLFIHAHPDDESLDFGSLIAGASGAGKRVAVVLFTDGESGLDLYPQRTVGDIYPARKLAGASLAQVRVVEATRALSVLGAEAYVRLGLINRPYSSEREALPLQEVLEGWGGEERLITRLVEIIQGFQPALVFSPDSRSEAHEHFEHEAVGYLVRRALAVLGPGAPYLKGHLVCVDPYQKDGYGDLIAVSTRAGDPVSGLELRRLQAAALAEHISQRDAAVLGVARLSRVPYEYYKPLLWRPKGPPDLGPYLK